MLFPLEDTSCPCDSRYALARKRVAALLIHLLTASGSVCGLLALYFAARQDWAATFLWLGVALVIDGVDGPLARRIVITDVLPRFSGVSLDEAVDFLNFCIVPAFILLQGDLFRPWVAFVAAALVLLTSLFHFADRNSKTDDGYFVGFPAAWNLVCFYFFVFGIDGGIALVIIILFSGLTFVPLKWAHPFRVRRFRILTFIVLICWSAAAIAALAGEFPSGPVIQAIFAVSALYVLALGLARSFGQGEISE